MVMGAYKVLYSSYRCLGRLVPKSQFAVCSIVRKHTTNEQVCLKIRHTYCVPTHVCCNNVSVCQVMDTACPSMYAVTECTTAMVKRMKMNVRIPLALVFTAVVAPLSVCTRPTLVMAGASVLRMMMKTSAT